MKIPTLLMATSLALCIKAADKPNILFIAIDDMRPEVGCYGSELAVTPNLDRLASKGLLFEKAYCQQAICSPSRASLMTGARPDTIGIIENYTYFRDANPNIVTLPQYLITQGYETVHAGKIYHGRFDDQEKSWSRQPVASLPGIKRPMPYAKAENLEIQKRNRAEAAEKYDESARAGLGNGPAYEAGDVEDHYYVDGYDTLRAIATLKEMVADDVNKPFFLGLGFKRPHLNWVAPKRYWDLYDPEEISLAKHQDPPKDGAAMGFTLPSSCAFGMAFPRMGRSVLSSPGHCSTPISPVPVMWMRKLGT